MPSGLPDFIDPSLPVDVEPRVYTTEEFLKMAEEGRRIIGEILAYGKLLAGDPEIIEAARKCFPTGKSREAPKSQSLRRP
ncbi:MAG: hypothetical protein QXY49_07350 [Thermofilaceae archaeon]